MNIQLSLPQILAFITFVILVGPALFWIGRLWERVGRLEDSDRQQWEILNDVRDMMNRLVGERESEK